MCLAARSPQRRVLRRAARRHGSNLAPDHCDARLPATAGGVYGSGVPSLIAGYFFRLVSNSPTILNIGSTTPSVVGGDIAAFLPIPQQVDDPRQGELFQNVVHTVLLDEMHLLVPPFDSTDRRRTREILRGWRFSSCQGKCPTGHHHRSRDPLELPLRRYVRAWCKGQRCEQSHC